MLAERISAITVPAGCAVRVWQVPLQNLSLEESLAMLSPEEQTRAARFHQQADRARFVLTRAALRLLLADALNTSPTAIAITPNAFGKPHLAGESELYFNVAHSGNLALIALADGARVGVDVEQWRTDVDAQAVLSQIASTNEIAFFKASPEAEHAPSLFKLWTLKEALLKAQGMGFQRDPRQWDVIAALHPSDSAHIVSVITDITDPLDGSAWQVGALAVPPSYSAAWAVHLPKKNT